MRKIVERFVEYPIYANLIIAFVVIAGVAGLLSMKKRFFLSRKVELLMFLFFIRVLLP